MLRHVKFALRPQLVHISRLNIQTVLRLQTKPQAVLEAEYLIGEVTNSLWADLKKPRRFTAPFRKAHHRTVQGNS